MPPCDHASICLEPSSHAHEVGYRGRYMPTTTSHGRRLRSSGTARKQSPSSFPAPLVLPGDELSQNPDNAQQTFNEWLHAGYRNEVTSSRNVIYVAAPPIISPEVETMSTWRRPKKRGVESVPSPDIQDVVEYLAAFYHGLPVKLLENPKLTFALWQEDDDSNNNSRASKKRNPKPKSPALNSISIQTSTERIRIRTRPSPDRLFPRQLNLYDILDVAIAILPADAYALLQLVEHDLFEDADDVFICGRAYGGSRVAVVSTARYNPGLDALQGVDREHAWPAAHCQTYMDACCQSKPQASKKRKFKPGPTTSAANPGGESEPEPGPIHAAISAFTSPNPSPTSTSQNLSNLYLTRILLTTSHELGHCFGIAHCVAFACAMQGSGSLAEDARQPLYLCPIDAAKVLHATGVDERARDAALLRLCEMRKKHGDGGKGEVLCALAAWLRGRRLEGF